MTEREQRIFQLLSRMVSTLVMIQLDIERGYTNVALESHMAGVRRYLQEQCPSLLTWVEMCYRNQEPPYILHQVAEIEAAEGLQARL